MLIYQLSDEMDLQELEQKIKDNAVPELLEIYLSNVNSVHIPQIDKLIYNLAHQPIKVITIKICAETYKDFAFSLRKLIEKNSTLTTCTIKYHASLDNFPEFAVSLRNTKIKNIVLEYNSKLEFTEVVAKEIAKVLINNPHIKQLSLQIPSLLDRPLQIICEALKVNKSLNKLVFEGKITIEQGNFHYYNPIIQNRNQLKYICDFLKHNNTLASLDLDTSYILKQDILYFAKQLKKSCLLKLKLNFDDFTQEEAINLVSALRKNSNKNIISIYHKEEKEFGDIAKEVFVILDNFCLENSKKPLELAYLINKYPHIILNQENYIHLTKQKIVVKYFLIDEHNYTPNKAEELINKILKNTEQNTLYSLGVAKNIEGSTLSILPQYLLEKIYSYNTLADNVTKYVKKKEHLQAKLLSASEEAQFKKVLTKMTHSTFEDPINRFKSSSEVISNILADHKEHNFSRKRKLEKLEEQHSDKRITR